MAFIVELAAPAVAAGGVGNALRGGERRRPRGDGLAAFFVAMAGLTLEASLVPRPSTAAPWEYIRPPHTLETPPDISALRPRPPYMASMAAALRDLGVMLT